jgi:hypothetical protein
MIWFGCKKCGKRHSRAESLCGTLVFCECGFGNRVPYESTVPEPDLPPAAPAPPPRARTPRLDPVDDHRRPPRRSIPVDDQDDWQPPAFRTRPRKEPKKINPNYCLVHDEKPSEHTCKDCQMRFCSSCVVTLQGDTLCGPCKNFRLRGTHRPAPVSQAAVVSALAGLVSAPIGFCASFWGMAQGGQAGGHLGGAVLAVVLGLAFPLAGLVVGGLALRHIENTPNVGGRFLAMTGTVAGLIGTLWSATVGLLLIVRAV